MSTRSFAFSVMLATYLSGLALGSALIARSVDRVKNPWGLFGFLIAAAGFIALIEISFLGPWLSNLQSVTDQTVLSLTESRLAGMSSRFAIAAIYIVFVPTLFLGAAFPVVLKLIVDSKHVGRDIGKVVALNTLGGITGTIITGFLLIPKFGLVKTLAILAVAAALLGFLASIRGNSHLRTLRYTTFTIVIATLIAAFLTPKDQLANLLVESRGGKMTFYKEGQGGTVAVLDQKAGKKSFSRLYIQGVSNTGDAMPSLRYMRLQALLPLIIHNGEPKSALVIGLGTGITSGALLCYPGLEKRVVAELLPEVLQSSVYFKGNYDVTNDPKMDIRLRDGRRELLSNNETYDIITLEPPPPSASGVVNLYSSDFYKLAQERLNSNGIVAQWLPLPTQNDEDTQSLVKSFIDVFPYASLWTTELHEMLLIGSMDPLLLNTPKIIERFNQPETLAALKEVGISTPEALMATWITNRNGLEEYAGDVLPVTDNWPRIEYADWVRFDEIHRVLPKFIMLRNDPPLKNVDDDFLKKLSNERQILLLFYQAALNGSQGYKEEWARDMQSVLNLDRNNAYYQWFGEKN
jgi:spermidine synthase